MEFYYKAKEGPDKIVEGTVEAESRDAAVRRVMRLGYAPLDVKAGAPGRRKFRPALSLPGAGKVRREDVMVFTRQMCDLVNAGVPLLRALQLVQKQTRSRTFSGVIQKMSALVQDGGTLSAALGSFPAVFSPLYVNVVNAGEVGGNLGVVLERLAGFVEKDYEIQAQVKTSLLYPGLILLAGSLTIFVILTWVIPRIATIFEDMNESLPVITLVLLRVSGLLARFWWLLAVMVLFAGVYFRRLGATAEGKCWIDRVKLRIPVTGQLIKDVEIGRFARTLGTLLSNGVAVVPAIETVRHVIDNEMLRQEVQGVVRKVVDGASLTQALKGCAVFPEAAVNMVSIGEETGRLHEGLIKLAEFYEHQSERAIKRITSLIEPVLILVVGFFIGVIVLGMLLPIFNMNMVIR